MKPILGITMGDPAGVGAEIIVKALSHSEIYDITIPVVIGEKTILEDALSFLSSNLKINTINDIADAKGNCSQINLLDLNNIEINDFEYGQINKKAGKASIEYILKAIDLANSKVIEGIVTAPIHKKAINLAGFKYSGHTEILADKTSTRDYAMMLTDKDMRVIHVSTHVSLRKACELVKKDRILKVIRLADTTVKKMGIDKPRIAVAGLNPHAGDEGLFGNEEFDEIIPAIKVAEKENIYVEGPIPSDTLFSKLVGKLYDIAVVMYHDQGHIPMKLNGFKYNKSKERWDTIKGVNATVGLPIIRTSVDHGVAFDIAGEGKANEESMIAAIKMAASFIRGE